PFPLTVRTQAQSQSKYFRAGSMQASSVCVAPNTRSYKVLSKPTTPLTTAEPDRGDIQRLATDALQALKAVREQLNREMESIRVERQQIESDRQRLLAEQTDLEHQHQAHESELNRINELAAKLEKQQAEIEQSIAELESQKNGVAIERD